MESGQEKKGENTPEENKKNMDLISLGFNVDSPGGSRVSGQNNADSLYWLWEQGKKKTYVSLSHSLFV